MKQYVIDELQAGEHERLKAYLKAVCGPPELEEIYWLLLDESLYTPTQAAHTDCQPFYAAIHLSGQAVAVEFLIRTKNRMRCDCMGYATPEQTAWLMKRLDEMLAELEIHV
ncbi:MAG: hypothetical protein ACOCTS_01530 [Thermodesulfobacteriota bacterium]